MWSAASVVQWFRASAVCLARPNVVARSSKTHGFSPNPDDQPVVSALNCSGSWLRRRLGLPPGDWDAVEPGMGPIRPPKWPRGIRAIGPLHGGVKWAPCWTPFFRELGVRQVACAKVPCQTSSLGWAPQGPVEAETRPTLGKRPTWNLKMNLWKTIFLYKTSRWFSGSVLIF